MDVVGKLPQEERELLLYTFKQLSTNGMYYHRCDYGSNPYGEIKLELRSLFLGIMSYMEKLYSLYGDVWVRDICPIIYSSFSKYIRVDWFIFENIPNVAKAYMEYFRNHIN